MSAFARTAVWRPGLLLAACLAAFLALGGVGLYGYLQNFLLYRGFAPPTDPAWVARQGTVLDTTVASPAIGGRSQLVQVFLPPGYAQHPKRRYPTIYLLHGSPGRPQAFLGTVRTGVVQDELVARRQMRPTIEVMPFGSTSTFVDKQWANGYQPNEGWETFVARDLVRAIDSRFRTIRSGSARAIGGLSSGGYGAINIALHHPGEFRVVESWSGYERAENIAPIFGGQAARLAYNSPLDYLPHVAARLRAAGVRFWFYTGIHDAPHLRAQNRLFAAELTRLGILHRSIVVRGGHNWRVWRAMGPAALVYASRHLAHR